MSQPLDVPVLQQRGMLSPILSVAESASPDAKSIVDISARSGLDTSALSAAASTPAAAASTPHSAMGSPLVMRPSTPSSSSRGFRLKIVTPRRRAHLKLVQTPRPVRFPSLSALCRVFLPCHPFGSGHLTFANVCLCLCEPPLRTALAKHRRR